MGISFGRFHQLLPALSGNFLYILQFNSFSRLCPLGPAIVSAYRLDSTDEEENNINNIYNIIIKTIIINIIIIIYNNNNNI